MALVVLCFGLLTGNALAHSVPLHVHWTVEPAHPVVGKPAAMAVDLGDQLGGAAAGYQMDVTASSAGQTPITVPLTEAKDGHYTGQLALPATGTWQLKVTAHVLDENQVGKLSLQVVTQPDGTNPPLVTEQWLTIEYTWTHLVLTWGAFGAGLVIIAMLLLTGRKSPVPTDANEGTETE